MINEKIIQGSICPTIQRKVKADRKLNLRVDLSKEALVLALLKDVELR